jgi:hypothetical protein
MNGQNIEKKENRKGYATDGAQMRRDRNALPRDSNGTSRDVTRPSQDSAGGGVGSGVGGRGKGQPSNSSSKLERPTPTPYSPPATSPRETATFEPYYWEAYNEIVEPRRFDHYLIRKWLPELGALGFAIVKTLRDRCYHNPQTGVLRDSCEVDMDELATAVGVGRTTLFREFGRNESLGRFVRKVVQYQMVGGRPQQTKNLYQVCMDDPIHPDDLGRYDDLRARKETERDAPLPAKRIKREANAPSATPLAYESQNGTHSVPEDASSSPYGYQNGIHSNCYEFQNGTPNTPFQNGTPNTPFQNETAIRKNLPSGESLTKENSHTPSPTPAEAAPARQTPSHKCVPPMGEGNRLFEDGSGTDRSEEMPDADPLTVAWEEALADLAERMSVPTYQAHIRTLRPVGMERSSDAEGTVIVTLLCRSPFTREWIDKRHRADLETALSATVGEPVVVMLTLAASAAEGKA